MINFHPTIEAMIATNKNDESSHKQLLNNKDNCKNLHQSGKVRKYLYYI